MAAVEFYERTCGLPLCLTELPRYSVRDSQILVVNIDILLAMFEFFIYFTNYHSAIFHCVGVENTGVN